MYIYLVQRIKVCTRDNIKMRTVFVIFLKKFEMCHNDAIRKPRVNTSRLPVQHWFLRKPIRAP